ncbi:hypothetical protein APSETT444_010581 [Aspergillus pseudonomiae]
MVPAKTETLDMALNTEPDALKEEKKTPLQLISQGACLPGNMSRPANAAGFLIHSAVHKARPDVNVACHTHSPHGMAWSAFGRPLEMLTQDAAYLYGDAQAVYQDFGGVVLSEEEGNRIGAALGTLAIPRRCAT